MQSWPVLPSLCTGHNVVWCGTSLFPVWVSCPGSQQCTCWLAEHGRARSPWFGVRSAQQQPKKSVCYQHKFKTGSVPAAKKKNNSLPIETRTGTQAAAIWGCPSRERRDEHPDFESHSVWSEFNLDWPYSLLSLALLSICLFTPPSEYISGKLTTITDQWVDQEREKVAMTVRCKLQLSFYSLKPDLNPVPDILVAKDTYALFADTKTYFNINPRCSSWGCICVRSDFGLMNSWVLLCQMRILFRINDSFCKMEFCSLVVFLPKALNVYSSVHK